VAELQAHTEHLPGLDLTAYRITQEALVNALKHAGQARAQVSIRYRPRELDLEITGHGHGTAAHADRHGHGLAGLRERVALYACEAGIVQPGDA
jgi:signal transduction histidine kinase